MTAYICYTGFINNIPTYDIKRIVDRKEGLEGIIK